MSIDDSRQGIWDVRFLSRERRQGAMNTARNFDLVKEGRYEELNVTFRKCFLRILGGYRR